MKIFAMLFAVVLAHPAIASTDTATELYSKAQEAFAAREDLAKNDEALSLLAQAEIETTDDALKYQIYILSGRALYWKGKHAGNDTDKSTLYKQIQAKADQAIALNDDGAEGYYWRGLGLAVWLEVNGAAALSSAVKKDLIDHLEGAKQRQTIDGKPGQEQDGWGSDRILGRMYRKLPPLLGRDLTKSRKFLELAYTNSPDYPLNVIYYADTMIASGMDDKGCAALKDLLAKDPSLLNQDRVPENKEELIEAKQFKDQNCK